MQMWMSGKKPRSSLYDKLMKIFNPSVWPGSPRPNRNFPANEIEPDTTSIKPYMCPGVHKKWQDRAVITVLWNPPCWISRPHKEPASCSTCSLNKLASKHGLALWCSGLVLTVDPQISVFIDPFRRSTVGSALLCSLVKKLMYGGGDWWWWNWYNFRAVMAKLFYYGMALKATQRDSVCSSKHS